MSITYVNSDVVNNASGTSGTINKPSGVSDGDYLILTLNTQVAVTSPTLAGWTVQHSGSRMHVLVKFASSEPTSWSPSWTNSSNVVIGIIAFRGVNTSGTIIASATTETNLGNDVYTTAALSFAQQNYMYVSAAAHASPNSVLLPAGFTASNCNTIHSANGVRGTIVYESVENTSGASSVTFDYGQGGVTTVWSAALSETPPILLSGQAQAQILAFNVNAFAQAQSDILQTYNTFAQAQSLIKRTEQGHAQAQARIYLANYLRPIADITTNNIVGVVI